MLVNALVEHANIQVRPDSKIQTERSKIEKKCSFLNSEWFLWLKQMQTVSATWLRNQILSFKTDVCYFDCWNIGRNLLSPCLNLSECTSKQK